MLRRFGFRWIVGTVIVVPALTGCHGPSIIFGSPNHPGGSFGITQKIETIRICASALSDIRASARVAAKPGAGAAGSTVDVGPLVSRLRVVVSGHPGLPVSRSIDRLIVALNEVQLAAKKDPTKLPAAANALGTAAENVVTTCAAVGR